MKAGSRLNTGAAQSAGVTNTINKVRDALQEYGLFRDQYIYDEAKDEWNYRFVTRDLVIDMFNLNDRIPGVKDVVNTERIGDVYALDLAIKNLKPPQRSR